MNADIKKVLRKINKLKKQVSEDWATQIGEKMGRDARTIRAYANGTRGVRDGAYLEVLEHLQTMVAERQNQIEKLTA